MDNRYLQHYGVLGQKWGQRRFQNPDGTLTPAGQKRYEKTGEYGYTYKSHATKKYDRKAAKAESRGDAEKAEKYKNRADLSRELDKREMDYANSVKAGGNYLTRALTSGVIGGKAYQMNVAMNNKAQTTGSKAVSAILANYTGRLGANIRKAMYIRSNENTRMGAAGRRIKSGDTFSRKVSDTIDDALKRK